MGLSSSQGRFLMLQARNMNMFNSLNKIQNKQIVTEEKSESTVRTLAEIQKELSEVQAKIKSMPKEYVTKTETTTKYPGVVKMEKVQDSKGNITSGSVTLQDLSVLNFSSGKDYTDYINSIKVTETKEVSELVMTQELKDLYEQAEKLRDELQEARTKEIEERIAALRESISTKNLPTDTLLANRGINITAENKIEQPFQNFSDEADSTSQEIKSTNTEKDIESPFNLFG